MINQETINECRAAIKDFLDALDALTPEELAKSRAKSKATARMISMDVTRALVAFRAH